MGVISTILEVLVFGFIGLVAALIGIALIFGKRIRKEWEFEAEFRDERGREFGEFDIESSRIEKQEPDFTLKAKFRMRHAALQPHKVVEIYLDDLLVLQGSVNEAGRIRLDNRNLRNTPTAVAAGQTCAVAIGGSTMFSEPLRPD